MTENVHLPARQLKAVEKLAAGRRVGAVANSLGISPKTLLRWRSRPEFVASLASARNEAFAETVAALRLSAGRAASVCNAIMRSSVSTNAERLAAARCVLSVVLKASETVDTEQRLAALESRDAFDRAQEMEP